MNGLLGSIIHRPYVFAFLAAYLFLAIRSMKLKRTILWLVSAYILAWCSEYLSINYNIPYGEYHYVYENLKTDLLIFGVPFFDSLSYAFLTFAGYSTAKYAYNCVIASKAKQSPSRDCFVAVAPRNDKSDKLLIIFLGALLTTLLDVIIDPIATMGDKWFLGQIHYYAHPGFYFGVPLTNFAGWFITSFAIIGLNEIISGKTDTKLGILYPLFYSSIALFSTVISFWIGQWKMGLASLAILGLIDLSIISLHRFRGHDT